jgi:hypothetical protein
MKRTTIQRIGLILGAIISAISLTVLPAGALATPKTVNETGTSVKAGDQAKVQRIIARGNSEISRRLNTLNTLNGKINSATKLSAADKAPLSSEVLSEIDGLNNLKTKLDADTTVSDAQSDAQSIINDYRVYALIVPKINLIKTADDQQVAEAKLSALATKLQTRVTTAKTAGKNVTSLQSGLDGMNSKISTAQSISSQIESSVINLQPSDYNTNHSVLSGDRNQLKTAQTDIQAAVTAGTTIVNGLKNL